MRTHWLTPKVTFFSRLWSQLGPQQLKYTTFLRDSSDCFILSSFNLLETIAEVEEERFLVWEIDLRWFLACCCADRMIKFHLQIPWSFMASTTPTLTATIAFLVELIFQSSQHCCLLLKMEAKNCKLYVANNTVIRRIWDWWSKGMIGSLIHRDSDGSGVLRVGPEIWGKPEALYHLPVVLVSRKPMVFLFPHSSLWLYWPCTALLWACGIK